MGLVKKFASFWAMKFPYAADDILSVAYVALIEACNTWPGEGNLEGWIKRIVDIQIGKYISEDRTIAVPARTVQWHWGRGTIANLPSVLYEDADKYPSAKKEASKKLLTYEQLEPHLTDTEKKILKLRLKKKTLKEIAQLLGMQSHTNVIYHLKKIQAKYKWLNDNS